MKKQIAAGGVLFNPVSKKYYLIYKKERQEWLLPKGHVEKDESREEAALRETREETGYYAIEKAGKNSFLGQIEYNFKSGEEEIHKTVYFYLFFLLNDSFQETSERKKEGLTGKWCSPEEGDNLLSYKNYKKILNKAKKLRLNSPKKN